MTQTQLVPINHPFLVLCFPRNDVQLAPLATLQDGQPEDGPNRQAGQQPVDIIHVGDVLAVECDDQVALAEAGSTCRAVLFD